MRFGFPDGPGGNQKKRDEEAWTARRLGTLAATMSLSDELPVESDETWALADDPEDEAPIWWPLDQSAGDSRRLG